MNYYCQNCGHICHCGKNCEQNYDGKDHIICCSHCRHEKVDESWKDEVNYEIESIKEK